MDLKNREDVFHHLSFSCVQGSKSCVCRKQWKAEHVVRYSIISLGIHTVVVTRRVHKKWRVKCSSCTKVSGVLLYSRLCFDGIGLMVKEQKVISFRRFFFFGRLSAYQQVCDTVREFLF